MIDVIFLLHFRTGKKENASCFFYTFWNCTFAFPIVSMCRLLSGAQVDSLLYWYRAAKRERRFGLYFDFAACSVTSVQNQWNLWCIVACGAKSMELLLQSFLPNLLKAAKPFESMAAKEQVRAWWFSRCLGVGF